MTTQDRIAAAVVGWAGAVAILVGILLPARESTTFSSIEQNTLIQSGSGIALGVAALVIAWRVYRTWTSREKPLWIAVPALWAAGFLIYDWTTSGKLYPIVNGQADTSATPASAPAGIGLYVVALGVVLAGASAVALAEIKRKADRRYDDESERIVAHAKTFTDQEDRERRQAHALKRQS